MWKQMLDFDLRAQKRSTPVKEIIEGKSFNQPLGGMIGVSCVGRDGWLGSPLAMANLYAFGRLAWDPSLSADTIAIEWIQQTVGTNIRGREHCRKNADAVVARVRALHRPVGHADADRHNRQPLRARISKGASATAGASGTATTRGASAWTARVATGTGFAGQYPPQSGEDVRVAEQRRRTICSCSSITFRTPTNCAPAKPSSNTSTTATTRARTKRRSSSMNGKR